MDRRDQSANGYYRSLTRNIVLIILVVSVSPLILISGTIGYYFDVSYHEKALDHLKVLVKKHRQNVDNFLHEKLADIGLLAKSYTFEQLTDEAFLKDRLTLLQGTVRTIFCGPRHGKRRGNSDRIRGTLRPHERGLLEGRVVHESHAG